MSFKRVFFISEIYHILIFLGLFVSLFASCRNNTDSDTQEGTHTSEDTLVSSADLPYVISLKEMPLDRPLVGLQSAVVGRWKNKLLCWGGRKSGFHGRAFPQNQFTRPQANDSIWVIDIENFESWRAPIPESYQSVFVATNSAHCQSGETLYATGGYTFTSAQSKQNDGTSPVFIAVDLPNMIQAIIAGEAIEPHILFTLSDPRLQITGGELDIINDYFCLVMGQNYEGTYVPGKDGQYTEQVRFFQLADDTQGGRKIINYQTLDDPKFHRRDLNVVPMWLNNRKALAVYGGVFTSDDEGWSQPIYIVPNEDTTFSKLFEDKFQQKSNQYECAHISILDVDGQEPKLHAMATTLLGGIGLYQYHSDTGQWEKGDQGVPLPFVKLISTEVSSVDIEASERQAFEWHQLAPDTPEMPGFLGTNALFIPDTQWIYQGEGLEASDRILDFKRFPLNQEVRVGLLWGGILATAPTSSGEKPTYANDKVYEVMMERRKEKILDFRPSRTVAANPED